MWGLALKVGLGLVVGLVKAGQNAEIVLKIIKNG
jgi:hypothetical protein